MKAFGYNSCNTRPIGCGGRAGTVTGKVNGADGRPKENGGG